MRCVLLLQSEVLTRFRAFLSVEKGCREAEKPRTQPKSGPKSGPTEAGTQTVVLMLAGEIQSPDLLDSRCHVASSQQKQVSHFKTTTGHVFLVSTTLERTETVQILWNMKFIQMSLRCHLHVRF